MKVPNFTFCRGREHRTTTFFFFSWTLAQSFRTQLPKNCRHLTNWTRWNKRDQVWGSTNSLFKWRFRCCLSSLVMVKLIVLPFPLSSQLKIVVVQWRQRNLQKRVMHARTHYCVSCFCCRRRRSFVRSSVMTDSYWYENESLLFKLRVLREFVPAIFVFQLLASQMIRCTRMTLKILSEKR